MAYKSSAMKQRDALNKIKTYQKKVTSPIWKMIAYVFSFGYGFFLLTSSGTVGGAFFLIVGLCGVFRGIGNLPIIDQMLRGINRFYFFLLMIVGGVFEVGVLFFFSWFNTDVPGDPFLQQIADEFVSLIFIAYFHGVVFEGRLIHIGLKFKKWIVVKWFMITWVPLSIWLYVRDVYVSIFGDFKFEADPWYSLFIAIVFVYALLILLAMLALFFVPSLDFEMLKMRRELKTLTKNELRKSEIKKLESEIKKIKKANK